MEINKKKNMSTFKRNKYQKLMIIIYSNIVQNHVQFKNKPKLQTGELHRIKLEAWYENDLKTWGISYFSS